MQEGSMARLVPGTGGIGGTNEGDLEPCRDSRPFATLSDVFTYFCKRVPPTLWALTVRKGCVHACRHCTVHGV